MTIRLEHPEFHASVADVRDASTSIGAARARAGGLVAQLLDGGWSGAAATAFASAWEDWLAAAASVRHDLDGLADLLAAAHQDVTAVDQETGCGLEQLARRLG